MAKFSPLTLATLCTLALCAAAGTRTNIQFKPLDPNNTDPAEFWLPLWDPVPEEYCEAPRYPVVPTPGPMAPNVLYNLIPNGTVPKVRAKPTNSWQKNLWGFQFNETDADHWNAIYPYPYIASPKDNVLFLMYPGAPVNLTDNRQIQVGFDTPYVNKSVNHGPPIRNQSSPWMSMSLAYDLTVTITNAQPRLVNMTPVSATVAYVDAANKTVATAYLVKGSPFISIECTGAQIGFSTLRFPDVPPVVSINGQNPGSVVNGKAFTLFTAAGPAHPQGVYWHAYFSTAVSINIPAPPTEGSNLTAPFSGLLQIACGEINDQMKPFLDKAQGVYAKGVELAYDINDDTQQLTMHFNWIKGGDASKTLTMLALRHHTKIIKTFTPMHSTAYWMVKGNMTAVMADSWQLTYNLTSAGFGDALSLDRTMVSELEKAALLDYDMRIGHCPGDNITYGYPGHVNMELYAYVRNLAQRVDLATILEALGHREHAVNMSKNVLQCMEPVLRRPERPPEQCPTPLSNFTPYCMRSQTDIYFDQQFGGLVTTWYTRFAPHYCACDLPGGPTACIGKNYCDNLHGWAALANYGNPLYNDHHFQYGYIIKSLAWLVYFQETKNAPLGINATYMRNITKQALAFAREVGNPDDRNDPYFTYVRHKDVYDGHSWAEGYDYSGRFVSWNNQQSGGESINAYYGIYLLGLALNDTNVRDWGRITLATEMFSLAQYQHLSNETKDKDDQPVSQITDWGKCISTLYGTGFSGNTYFGPNMLLECAITFLPITPITREWISPRWANETYHWLEWSVNMSGFCVFYDPLTMTSNPCPGPYSSTWTGNEWGCCPTNEGYVDNQWRTFPEWMPYLHVLESFFNPRSAFRKLLYADWYLPTPHLPFPYLANRSSDQPTVVGFQHDITLASALFAVATHGNP